MGEDPRGAGFRIRVAVVGRSWAWACQWRRRVWCQWIVWWMKSAKNNLNTNWFLTSKGPKNSSEVVRRDSKAACTAPGGWAAIMRMVLRRASMVWRAVWRRVHLKAEGIWWDLIRISGRGRVMWCKMLRARGTNKQIFWASRWDIQRARKVTRGKYQWVRILCRNSTTRYHLIPVALGQLQEHRNISMSQTRPWLLAVFSSLAMLNRSSKRIR